jgi:hypothetical protein
MKKTAAPRGAPGALIEDGLGPLDTPIWGVEAIARVIGRSPRQTLHLLSTGSLPGKSIGRRWMTTRRLLLGAFGGLPPPGPSANTGEF